MPAPPAAYKGAYAADFQFFSCGFSSFVQNITLCGASTAARNSSGHTLTCSKSPANVTTFDIINKTILVPSLHGTIALENAS
jgi:hypothetical protein